MDENLNGAVRLVLGALAFAVLGACATRQREESIGRTRLALTSYTITMPKGASLGQFALIANGSLDVGDHVRVLDSSGGAVGVANAGSQVTLLGVESSLGAVRSIGAIRVSDRAKVGDLTSAGQIQPGNGVTLNGGVHANSTDLTPVETQTISVDLSGTSLGDVTLNSPNSGEAVMNLTPGRYDHVLIQPRNRVNLRSGSYVLNSLDIEPQSRFVIDDSAGPVLLSVRDTLLYKGTIQSLSGSHPALRFLYAGTQAVTLETPFTGTFLAPNAGVRLATVNPPARFVGSFFAQTLTVSPDCVVEYRPYIAYQVTRDFEVSSAGFGKFGYAAVTPDRTINARVHNNVVKVGLTGTTQALLATPIDVQYLVDPDTGAFGFYGDHTFERHRPDGSLLGTYPTSLVAHAYFIPGAEKTAILLANDVEHEAEWISLRVVGPGLSFEVATPGLQSFAASSSRLVYNTASELVALDHAGNQAFRTSLALREFAVSSAGAQLIGVRAERGSARLVHVNLTDGTVISGLSLPSAPLALGIAPAGRYSFAATRTTLYLFDETTLTRQLSPGTDFASADINDAGEVVIGGANATNTVLTVAGGFGTQAFVSESGARDNIALRPYVRFEKGSADFIAVRKEGLSRYTVKRSL